MVKVEALSGSEEFNIEGLRTKKQEPFSGEDVGGQRVRPGQGARPQVLAAHILLKQIYFNQKSKSHGQIKGAGRVQSHPSIISGAGHGWASSSSSSS